MAGRLRALGIVVPEQRVEAARAAVAEGAVEVAVGDKGVAKAVQGSLKALKPKARKAAVAAVNVAFSWLFDAAPPWCLAGV